MASPFSLPIRLRLSLVSSTSTSSSCLAKPNVLQIRHASGPSTPRRARKALNIPPAPHAGGSSISAGGTSGRSHQPRIARPAGNSRSPGLNRQESGSERIIYAPPSSAPNIFHTPHKFLPRDDPRRSAAAQVAAYRAAVASHNNTGTGQGGEQLPPPLRKPYTKITAQSVDAGPGASTPPRRQQHLSATAVAEMRALRRSDEQLWTRARLADKFGCSPLFVGLVVAASPERRRFVEKQDEAVRARWSRKRRVAREERKLRREQWGRDE